MISTTEKLFKAPTNFISITTNYTYNTQNYQLASTKSINETGKQVETKIFYPQDYSSNSIPILGQMVNDNIVNIPVSTETWQTKSGIGNIPEMLSTSVTEFGIAPNGDYKPIKSYSLETDRPVSQNEIGVFNPNQLIRNTNLIKQQSELIYDAFGNNVSVKNIPGDKKGCTLFGYGNALPVISVSNAWADEVAYSSFEPNDNTFNSFQWNWNSAGNTITSGEALTGRRYLSGSVNTDIFSFKNKVYTLSFWAKSNNFILTPQILLTSKITGPTINGWTYYEYDVPATNNYYILYVNANGSGIDELRLYPKAAGMSSTTYDQNIGKTSDCDANNRIAYYEYDGLGRLVKVLDERRNIIKTYEYHFKN